ncbi:hypothetical protein Hypma_002506 [Hypsizygus marmoreus]|uniref:Uncharacterized protein n=1 Tax=Hypsizygus marmoreus TaxID=39966 RepID=A0A369J497_HYPMA|nr:hypothetical protein Hypma_002506 [Hypsizygus marmoreus]
MAGDVHTLIPLSQHYGGDICSFPGLDQYLLRGYTVAFPPTDLDDSKDWSPAKSCRLWSIAYRPPYQTQASDLALYNNCPQSVVMCYKTQPPTAKISNILMSYIYRQTPNLPCTGDNPRSVAHYHGALTADTRHNSHADLDDYVNHLRFSHLVCRNLERLPAIPFFRADGDSLGVDLTECTKPVPQRGLTIANTSILDGVRPERHPMLLDRSWKYLVIMWPGYQHLNWNHRLIFQHSNGAPYTVGELAKQVAELYRVFIQVYCDEFKGPGVRLGPLFVSFEQLRLNEIYSRDGITWHAEISYWLPS